jgi:hypothetical protein
MPRTYVLETYSHVRGEWDQLALSVDGPTCWVSYPDALYLGRYPKTRDEAAYVLRLWRNWARGCPDQRLTRQEEQAPELPHSIGARETLGLATAEEIASCTGHTPGEPVWEEEF